MGDERGRDCGCEVQGHDAAMSIALLLLGCVTSDISDPPPLVASTVLW